MQEETVRSRIIYHGKILDLRVDNVLLPNGREAEREVVVHPGAVAVVAVTEEQEVLLVRQYRHPVGEVLLEVPAGKLEQGEDPVDCAKRELAEETGYTADKWELLSRFYTTPGFSDEIMYLYLAQGLIPEQRRADDDEFIELCREPLETAVGKALSGQFKDAKTIVALFSGAFRLGILE